MLYTVITFVALVQSAAAGFAGAAAGSRLQQSRVRASQPSMALGMDLKGKVAFVAGVADSTGYGWAICKALAEAGATVTVGTWPPVLGIFEKSLKSGRFDDDMILSDGSKMEITSIYPLDAVFDVVEDVPEDVSSNKRYAGLDGFTISEVADKVAADYGKIDILVHSLANGPEVTKPLLETSRTRRQRRRAGRACAAALCLAAPCRLEPPATSPRAYAVRAAPSPRTAAAQAAAALPRSPLLTSLLRLRALSLVAPGRGYLAANSASAFSMVSLVQRFGPIMNPGGAVLSLTYIASEFVIPGYGGGMSSAKAALESDTKVSRRRPRRRRCRPPQRATAGRRHAPLPPLAVAVDPMQTQRASPVISRLESTALKCRPEPPHWAPLFLLSLPPLSPLFSPLSPLSSLLSPLSLSLSLSRPAHSPVCCSGARVRGGPGLRHPRQHHLRGTPQVARSLGHLQGRPQALHRGGDRLLQGQRALEQGPLFVRCRLVRRLLALAHVGCDSPSKSTTPRPSGPAAIVAANRPPPAHHPPSPARPRS